MKTKSEYTYLFRKGSYMDGGSIMYIDELNNRYVLNLANKDKSTDKYNKLFAVDKRTNNRILAKGRFKLMSQNITVIKQLKEIEQ